MTSTQIANDVAGLLDEWLAFNAAGWQADDVLVARTLTTAARVDDLGAPCDRAGIYTRLHSGLYEAFVRLQQDMQRCDNAGQMEAWARLRNDTLPALITEALGMEDMPAPSTLLTLLDFGDPAVTNASNGR